MGEKERFLPLATVRKTFGRGGELILKFRPDVPQNIIDQLSKEEPVFIQVDGIPVPLFRPDVPQNIIDQLSKEEPVFIQVDGIPVPFYFTSVTLRGNDQALVSFENYLTETLAAEWVGKTLLYKAGESATPSGGTLLVGYTFRGRLHSEDRYQKKGCSPDIA